MKPEFRIREVTRYVITRHDGKSTHAIAEVENEKSAKLLLAALIEQADRHEESACISISKLGIPQRWEYALRAQLIETVGDLQAKSRAEVMSYTNIGAQGLIAIQTAMRPYGGLREA